MTIGRCLWNFSLETNGSFDELFDCCVLSHYVMLDSFKLLKQWKLQIFMTMILLIGTVSIL